MSRAERRAALKWTKGKALTWGKWEERKFSPVEILALGFDLTGMKTAYLNNKYSVQIYEDFTKWGLITHLVIRNHDGSKGISWKNKQRIKNELIGENRTAVEVFPTAEHTVDDADVYHLWVFPEGFELPFGLHFEGWSKL